MELKKRGRPLGKESRSILTISGPASVAAAARAAVDAGLASSLSGLVISALQKELQRMGHLPKAGPETRKP